MYIIVAGAGLIGRRITEMLVKKNHDVVVIELKNEVCDLKEEVQVSCSGPILAIRVLQSESAVLLAIEAFVFNLPSESTSFLRKSLNVGCRDRDIGRPDETGALAVRKSLVTLESMKAVFSEGEVIGPAETATGAVVRRGLDLVREKLQQGLVFLKAGR